MLKIVENATVGITEASSDNIRIGTTMGTLWQVAMVLGHISSVLCQGTSDLCWYLPENSNLHEGYYHIIICLVASC